MQTFIYGFKPYGKFNENITEKIVSELPHSPNITKKIFEVEFNYEMFSSTLELHRPDLIIGLGQHPRARKLRIERKARNIYKSENQNNCRIRDLGSDYLYCNLDLPVVEGATKTYDAGTYVCNFSMYLMSEYSIKHKVKFAFLHVPVSIDETFIHRYLINIIDKHKG
jgi:pyrrolidone-carboxylate peptidase